MKFNKKLKFVFTCDTDADDFDPSIGQTRKNVAPRWDGIKYGIPMIIEGLEKICSKYSISRKSTWFVRVDPQIGYYFGSQAYLLEEFSSMWDHIKKSGDVIGWHPHIYKLESNNCWKIPYQMDEHVGLLNESYNCFSNFSGTAFASRMGEAFFSNQIALAIDQLGIQCDSTAIPGKLRRDSYRNIDWLNSPSMPYYPSEADFRVRGAVCRKFLEIPMSVIPIQAPYDKTPILRYVDLSFRHEIIRQSLSAFLEKSDLLVTITHPSAVLTDRRHRDHGLIDFSLKNFEKNVEFIIRKQLENGGLVELVTIKECYDTFVQQGILDVG